MSFLRPSTVFRAPAQLRPTLTNAPQAILQKRFAQGYGDGKGSPASEHPEKQGKLPSEELEHPGPPPPKVARGKSQSSPGENPGGKPASSSQSSSSSSSQSSPSSSSGSSSSSSSQAKPKSSTSKSGKSEVSERWKSEHGGKAPEPKILNEDPPGEKDQGVRRHNEEMGQRAERAHERVGDEEAGKDKVSKGFWAGQGGRDREP